MDFTYDGNEVPTGCPTYDEDIYDALDGQDSLLYIGTGRPTSWIGIR